MTHPSERMSEAEKMPPKVTKDDWAHPDRIAWIKESTDTLSSFGGHVVHDLADAITQLRTDLAAANERAERAEKSAAARMMMTPPTDNTPTVLSRYAKAIAAVVEAGGPEPTPFMRAAMFDDDMKPKTVGRIYREPIIAVLKEYVREDVVVWYQDREGRCAKSPSLLSERWVWTVGRMNKPDIYGGDECPTEAHIAFLEAIASVVAGEKGEVG